jgi:opacity protein-like surface antigen
MRTLLIALGAIVLSASSASAQLIDGSLRLHLELPVLGYQSSEIKADGADEGTTTGIFSIGPGETTLGLGLGYGVSEMIVLGTNLALQHSSIKPDEGPAVSATGVQILPYLEVVFGEGTTRPFVGGQLMLQLTSTENTDTTLFGLGALGGVHIFLTDSFSFDVSGRLYYMTGTSTFDSDDDLADELETDVSELGVLLLIGLSGWT